MSEVLVYVEIRFNSRTQLIRAKLIAMLLWLLFSIIFKTFGSFTNYYVITLYGVPNSLWTLKI